MISYVRTILYQYSADCPSKEYKEKYEPGWMVKHIDGVYDKTRRIIRYNWRQNAHRYKQIYNKNLVPIALLPKNILK